MHHPCDVIAPGRLEHIQRAFDIGPHISAGRFVGVWNRDQRGQMKNNILTLYVLVDEVAILDVSADDPHRLARVGDQ